jgi:hypothetical protein
MRYGDSADAKGFSFCFDCSRVEAAAWKKSQHY